MLNQLKQKTIKKNGGYITQNDYNQGNCLVLEKSWDDSFYTLIENEQIKYLRLSELAGWKDDHIDFLKNISTLKGVEIYSTKIKNISVLEALPNLRMLNLDCPYRNIDFSKLKHLEHLSIKWRLNSETIFDLINLLTINIVNFPYKDFFNFRKLLNLNNIKLTSRKLRTLNGIENLNELASIDLFRCPNLTTLKNIGQCKKLISLEIENCKNIHGISPIEDNKHLVRLAINNCGNIFTLKNLEHHDDLEEIIFIESTNIVDGNLSFFYKLPQLKNTRFADRKHYTIKRDDINLWLNQK